MNGRKINSSASTTATARRRRSSRCAASSRTRRSPSVSRRSAPRPISRSASISTTTRCRSFSSRPERASSPIPSTFPGRWATIPTTRPKRTSTPRTSSRRSPTARSRVLYQNDGFGKDYLIGLKDVLGADHAGMIVKEGLLRDLRADGRLAGRDAAGFRAPTSSSSRRRRNSPRRRSASPSISAGTRPAISATSRPRSPRC